VGALPPGRYVVRAIVTSSGKTVGKMVRPFQLLPNSRPAPAAAAAGAPPAANSNTVVMAVPGGDAGLIAGRPAGFNREDVLKPETLRATADAMEKNHPLAKGSLLRAGADSLGTALMALDAGDQRQARFCGVWNSCPKDRSIRPPRSSASRCNAPIPPWRRSIWVRATRRLVRIERP
jgi:hypothetical protein